MLNKYFKLAFKRMTTHKLFTFINIFGLAIGFAGSLLISVFIWNELNYESMHKKRDNIYRIAIQFGQQDQSMILPGAMPALGPAAKAEIAQVEDYVRITPRRDATIRVGDFEFKENGLVFADPSIFDIFTIKTSQADAEPLSDPLNVLLSASTAQKYFNRQDVIGKVIQYGEHPLKVSGVFEDIIGNSQIKPKLIASRGILQMDNPNASEWGSFGQDFTFLLLNTKTSAEKLEQELTALLIRKTGQQLANMIRIIPEHFPGIHLNSKAIGDIIPHGNKSYVYLFSTIAFFVLLVASLNFINLSTAKATSRAREVGVNKVLGARRSQLIAQFLIESMGIAFFAFIIAILVFQFFYPILVDFLNISIGIQYIKTIEFYAIIGISFIAIGLISGIFPALYLTHLTPVLAVQNNINPNAKKPVFRKILVVCQFVISIILIFGTTVIFRQLLFMQNFDIGMDKENIVLLNYMPEGNETDQTYEILKSSLLESAYISNVTGVYTLPGLMNIEKKTVRIKGAPEEEAKPMRFNGVDYSFINTFNIELLAGRNFSQNYSTDKSQAVILNEAAVKELGEKNIIGKQITNGDTYATVIGIVKDFHIESLHNDITPVVLYINPQRYNTIAVKISHNNETAALAFIESTWNRVNPEQKFEYTFMQDMYSHLYSAEEKVSQLFTIFSMLALCIASLGLFGLVAFSAEQKRKEIGIRKAIGATVRDVIALLSQDYIKMVLLAFIISMPISYFLMTKWLQNFTYRISIHVWMFILAGGIAFTIALSTMSWQAIQAARANPVKALRYE